MQSHAYSYAHGSGRCPRYHHGSGRCLIMIMRVSVIISMTLRRMVVMMVFLTVHMSKLMLKPANDFIYINTAK